MHESASGQNGWLSGKFEEVFRRQKEGADHASDAEVAQTVAVAAPIFWSDKPRPTRRIR